MQDILDGYSSVGLPAMPDSEGIDSRDNTAFMLDDHWSDIVHDAQVITGIFSLIFFVLSQNSDFLSKY